MITYRSREILAQLVPSWLTALIYWSLFYCTKLLVFLLSPKSRVWVRNSLAFGKARFAQSDIDISILVTDESEILRIQKWVGLFPLVHEINWYRWGSLRKDCQDIHPIELKFDPTLRKILSREERHQDFSPEQKLVFLLRKFESCHLQFLKQAIWQKSKWQHYFAMAGIGSDVSGPDDFYKVVDQLAQQCGVDRSLTPILKTYLKAETDGIPKHIFYQQLDQDGALLLSLFPHRFCFVENPVKPLLPKVMEVQLQWENWALQTQRRGAPTQEQKAHADRVHRWLAVSHSTQDEASL